MKKCPPFENGKRYYPLSQHYRECFGEKVYKVSISVAKSCPNREGLNGTNVCIFCDEWGSAAYHQFSNFPILKQIDRSKIITFDDRPYVKNESSHPNKEQCIEISERIYDSING